MTLPNYFNLAKLASQHSNFRIRKMGSVIVKRKPVSIGYNTFKSHRLYANGNGAYTIHAEIMALIRSTTNVAGGHIYVFRENKLGIAMAKPCNNCMKWIIENGLSRIYYTVSNFPYWEMIKL